MFIDCFLIKLIVLIYYSECYMGIKPLTAAFMEDVRNFGPLSFKINGHEDGEEGEEANKFIYLRLNYTQGWLKVISVEKEQTIIVQIGGAR